MTRLELDVLTEEIEAVMLEIGKDLFSTNVKKNRAKVRKESVKLEKLFKTYRKNSIKLEGEK